MDPRTFLLITIAILISILPSLATGQEATGKVRPLNKGQNEPPIDTVPGQKIPKHLRKKYFGMPHRAGNRGRKNFDTDRRLQPEEKLSFVRNPLPIVSNTGLIVGAGVLRTMESNYLQNWILHSYAAPVLKTITNQTWGRRR